MKKRYRVVQLLNGDWAIVNPQGAIMSRYSTEQGAQADLDRYGSYDPKRHDSENLIDKC